jgi:hypothetical protein
MHTPTKIMLIASLCTCLSLGKSFGAMNAGHDPSTGEVVYREHFKLSSEINNEQAFELIQKWFTQNPAKFTHQNIEQTGVNGGDNKAAVEQAFKNAQPLQSIDPESNRVVGRSVVKYYGNSNSSIKVMYIEYYVVLEIHGHDLTATIKQIKYHHFNAHYAAQVIYNWQGGKPFDSSDKFETLTSSPNSSADISNVNTFLNNDMTQLLNDLKMSLKGGNVLASNS